MDKQIVECEETSNKEVKPLTEAELKVYEINYKIFNLIQDATMKEVEKVSCQHGCKPGQKVYTDMMENMFKPNKDIKKDKK